MTDDENDRGDAEGLSESFDGGRDAGLGGDDQASAQAQGAEGYEGAAGGQSVEPGRAAEGRSNPGDWDPSSQGGGGGQVY